MLLLCLGVSRVKVGASVAAVSWCVVSSAGGLVIPEWRVIVCDSSRCCCETFPLAGLIVGCWRENTMGGRDR